MLASADVAVDGTTCFYYNFFFSRHRKDELEQRMSTLQESRRELMVQLEQLMMLLKVLQMCLSSIRVQCTVAKRRSS